MSSTRSKINSYENGGVEPSIAFVLKLQTYTKLSVKELFYEVLTLNQIPPLPLEDGQMMAGEPEAKERETIDLSTLFTNQENIKAAIDEIKMQLSGIENSIKNK